MKPMIDINQAEHYVFNYARDEIGSVVQFWVPFIHYDANFKLYIYHVVTLSTMKRKLIMGKWAVAVQGGDRKKWKVNEVRET